jgi:chloramphenicol-sensitive protein RarD
VERRGFAYGVLAYAVWGSFPLYFPLLDPAGTFEVLASRIAFSSLSTGLLLLVLRRRPRISRRAFRRLSVASVLIAVNWGVYIYAVDAHHVVEAALGYFINPLVTVALGVLVLHERLRRAQWTALGIGLTSVLVISAGLGTLPWLALVLALSFGGYGLVKKQVDVPALEGLFTEAGVLAIPAVALLLALNLSGHGTVAGHGAGHPLLLVSAGLVTAIPLLLFAGAASRLPLSSLGLLQYLTPILQLAVAVGIRHEPLPGYELAGFALVWLALIVLATDGWRHRPRREPAGRAAPADALAPAA